MIVKKNEVSFNSSSLGLVLRYSICLLLLAAPFARGLFFEAYSFPFFIIVALLFVLFLYEQVRQKESGFFNHPMDWAVLALFVAYIISLISAVNIRSGVVGVMKYAAYIMVFWICYRAAQAEKGYKPLLYSLYLAGIGMAIVSMLIYSKIIIYPYSIPDPMLAGTFEYHNALGIYAGVIFMIGLGLLISNRHIIVRAVLTGSNALLITAMLGSLSRGAEVLYPFAVLAFILLVGTGRRIAALTSCLAALVPGIVVAKLYMDHSTSPAAAIFVIGGFILAVGIQVGLDYLIKYLDKYHIKPGRRPIWIISAIILVMVLVLVITVSSVRNYFTQGSLARLTNITLQDQNVQDRIEFNHDAVKIIKDHPIIGVGAEGWQSLYHRYASRLVWSSKTHNYFLQTWVETGTLGFIALIAMWLALLHLLWKSWKQNRAGQNPLIDVSFWGTAVACFYLGAHSLIDFDMSYPAVAFLFFGLMGMLQGRAEGPSVIVETVKGKSGRKGRKQQELFSHWHREALIALSVGGIASLALALTAGFFWAAGNNYVKAQEIVKKDPNQALTYLDKAVGYDPLNAVYWAERARLLAAQAVYNRGDQAAYAAALDSCQKAVHLDPNNLSLLNSINQIYMLLGENDRGIQVAEITIQANPLDPGTYENLGNDLVAAGIYALNSGHKDQARDYWSKALKVPEQVPPAIDPPAVGLNYTLGQVKLLTGDRADGENLLKSMLQADGYDKKGAITPERQKQIQTYQLQSRAWLAASLIVSGDQSNAQKILDPIPAVNQNDIQNQVQKIKNWLITARSLNIKS